MSDLSDFESRSGLLSCTAKEVFDFMTDIRNFERFIPDGTIRDWSAEKEHCSFSVSMLGKVTLSLDEKEKYRKVAFSGDALKKNDFSITIDISENVNRSAEVRIRLNAELNPMMKVMAAKPIAQFLEMLIIEMEKFRGWKDIIE